LKTLHFDCFAGISGDMTLSALVDLGVDGDELKTELEKLHLHDWSVNFVKDERCGIRGTYALVNIEQHKDGEHHHHHHTTWRDVRALIENAAISENAKKIALKIFTLIAEAEASVHGVPVDEIGFHEVGAVDSIIDIVGTAVCLDILKPDRITSGEIELGGGTVRCEHGVLNVPVPAVLKLCEGLPVHTGAFDKEMTTPTGAAILAACVDEFVTASSYRQIKTAYGLGTRKLERPNVLAVSWRDEIAPDSHNWINEELFLLETNIDDMTGEAFAFLMEKLFDEAALDVTITPTLMKKSRPGNIVCALCRGENLGAVRRTIFEHSSAIGLRETKVNRVSLPRRELAYNGTFGTAKAKKVFIDEKKTRTKIEYNDRAKIARERNISLGEAEELIKIEQHNKKLT
jgi:uncharacterized protein (TIGR00299 family) protein